VCQIVAHCKFCVEVEYMLFIFNEICDIVVIVQSPKVTGFRTMTQADVPLAFRLVSEVCMIDGVQSVFSILHLSLVNLSPDCSRNTHSSLH